MHAFNSPVSGGSWSNDIHRDKSHTHREATLAVATNFRLNYPELSYIYNWVLRGN